MGEGGDEVLEAHIAGVADEWHRFDPATFPFVHHIVDEFTVHETATSSARAWTSCSPASVSRPGRDDQEVTAGRARLPVQ